jgi:serine O-acetyltransferase
MLKWLFKELDEIRKRDPAAPSSLEVLLLYAGFHAIIFHHIAHWFYIKDFKFFGRTIAHFSRFLTGIEIHPAAKIGQRVFIDHGMGVVIGQTAEIGNDVTIFHGVTLGSVSNNKHKRHPTVENGVMLGASAKILGDITIGRGTRIGANALVRKSVPPYSIVAAVPAQIIVWDEAAKKNMPINDVGIDAVGVALKSIFNRLEKLEQAEVVENKKDTRFRTTDNGFWHGEDFHI